MKRSLFALPLALVACASPSHHQVPDSGSPVVDSGPFTPDPCKASLGQTTDVAVGSGQTFYKTMDDPTIPKAPDGTPILTWEKGPQGGHHVWIAIRLIGIRMQGTVTTVDLDDIENPDKPININHSRLIYDFTREEGGHCVLPGLRMQLDNAGGEALADLGNHHIRVTVNLKDPDGATATGSKVIVVNGTLF